ncbi:MAG: hypothetical protein ACJ72F_11775 [Nitrososphaeraceae archaeon]
MAQGFFRFCEEQNELPGLFYAAFLHSEGCGRDLSDSSREIDG